MRRLANTIGTVILSLILALIVWIGATSAENPLVRVERQVAIRMLDQPPDTVIVTRIESNVQARVAVPQNLLDQLRTGDLEAYVDLAEVPIGTDTDVPVVVQVKRRGVQVISYTPTSFTVRLERVESRNVPVRPNIIDTPPLGYVAREPLVEPAQVTVTGPAPAVERVAYASLDIWLRGSRETISRALAPTPLDKDGIPVAGVAVTPATVTVKVELAQRANFKPSVPIRVDLRGEVAPLYAVSNISLKPTSVTLVGLPSVLEGIPGFVETEPVDISDATASISKRVALKLPPGVSVVPESVESDASQMVQVDIEIVPITGGRTMQVPVSPQGLAPQYQATLSPAAVDVLLSGPLVQLQSLTVEEVEATVNLVEVGPGVQVLKPNVMVPAGVEVKGVVPEAVEVQVTEPEAEPTATPTGDGS